MTSGPIRQASADGLRGLNVALTGKFDVLKLLGDSEDCAYYLARDLSGFGFCPPGSSEQVILKVLNENASRDPRQVDLFYLEAEAASKLRHNNIAKASKAARYGGIHHTVIEHRPRAKTLRHLLDLNAWLDPHAVISLTQQIAAALEYAQKQEVLHLNLSPEVVLVEPDGTVSVTDFGIGAQNTLAWAQKERSGRAAVRYISPEQARGDKLDYRSDLYSLGILLFEMMTDRTPFDSEDPGSIKRKHVVQSPLPPHVYRAAVPQFLSAVVMELLEKQPDSRIQSGATLISLIDRLARSEEWGGGPQAKRSGQAREKGNDAPPTATLSGQPAPAQGEMIFLAQPAPPARRASAKEAEAYHNDNLSGLALSESPADASGALSGPDEAGNNPAPEKSEERAAYVSPIITALNTTPDSTQAYVPPLARPWDPSGLAGSFTGFISKAKSRVSRLGRKGYAALLIAALLIPAFVLALAPADRPSNDPSTSPATEQNAVSPNAGPEQSPPPPGAEGDNSAPVEGAQTEPASAAQGEAAGPGKEDQRPGPRRVLGSQGSRPKQYVRRSPYKPRKLRVRRHRNRAWRWMPFGS